MLAALADSVAKLSGKTPVGSRLRSQEWAAVPLALRERAQFSAGVESARVLGSIQSQLQKAISGQRESTPGGAALVDRSSFIGHLRKIVQDEGLGTGTGNLTDLSSQSRLGLIFDQQIRSANQFARWKTGQDADMLDAFPAQELLRIEARHEPRDWAARWAAAGGSFYGGRMIALKSDPIWTRISRFGTPYPPFDYGSGMGVEDVARDEAEKWGLIQPNQQPQPTGAADFNATLQASSTGLAPDMQDALQSIFGDQIQRIGESLVWQGSLIKDFVASATAGASSAGKVNLGSATYAAGDLAGYDLHLSADDVRQHAADSLAWESLPQAWRAPDSLTKHADGTYTAQASVGGTNVQVRVRPDAKQQQATIVSFAAL